MFKKKFLLLFVFYVSYIWVTTFSRSVLPTHFLSEHLTFQQMIFGTLLAFIGQMTLLVTLTKFTSRLSWRLALISIFLYILLIISIHNVYHFYLASFINGLAFFFFFIFYNIAHFKQTPQEVRGHSSALMFIAPSFIGIVAPILAGFLAQLNIVLLWAISLLSFLPSFCLVNFQDNFKVSYTLKSAIDEIRATRVFIFLEGIWEALVIGVIPIYTLYFIKTPLKYGIFISYLALVSIIANFTLGRMTDKWQKRSVFLYPLTTVMACTTILFTVTKSNITSWIVMTSIIQFLVPLFWNVSTAMVIDAHPNLHLAIPGRELMLASGRTLGLAITFVSFTLEKSPHFIFIVLGSIFLLYPITLFWYTKISKNYSYL